MPNSGRKLARLEYRTGDWDVKFREYIQQKMEMMPVVVIGDLNVVPNLDIDIWNPKNKKSAGTTVEERQGFQDLLAVGLIDSYRHMHPTGRNYTFWSTYGTARERNLGWRLDHALVSTNLVPALMGAGMLSEMDSDHCPIWIQLQI